MWYFCIFGFEIAVGFPQGTEKAIPEKSACGGGKAGGSGSGMERTHHTVTLAGFSDFIGCQSGVKEGGAGGAGANGRTGRDNPTAPIVFPATRRLS